MLTVLSVSILPLSVTDPLEVDLHNAVVKLSVLAIELRGGEHAGLEEVVAEPAPLAEVVIHARQSGPECPQHQLAVLLPDDLVPDAAGRPDALLPDRLNLRNHSWPLCMQDTLKDACGMIC